MAKANYIKNSRKHYWKRNENVIPEKKNLCNVFVFSLVSSSITCKTKLTFQEKNKKGKEREVIKGEKDTTSLRSKSGPFQKKIYNNGQKAT